MTPEQAKNAERLARYIEREQLVSLMNDTKWLETLQALEAIPGFSVRFRFKDVRDPEPAVGFWDNGLPEHIPYPFKCIEWLEIDPVVRVRLGRLVDDKATDFTDEVVQ